MDTNEEKIEEEVETPKRRQSYDDYEDEGSYGHVEKIRRHRPSKQERDREQTKRVERPGKPFR